MDYTILKNVLNEYSTKRNKAIQDAENRKRDLLSINPHLSELEKEIANTSIQISKELLKSNSENNSKLLADLKKKSNELIKEKNAFLKTIIPDNNYLKPKFECKHCKDTGYVHKDGSSQMCKCLKQRIFDVYYNKSNIGNLKKENFSKFNSNIFSDEKNAELYKSKYSPRENIEIIKEKALKFIENFDDPDEKSLLFVGNTGLGKTFLTNCIANELLNQQKNVLYQTAPTMFNEVIDAKFGKPTSSIDIRENILTTDLLIIDDLGVEHTTDLYISELFEIINTRIINQLKTIISTNLMPNEIEKIYTTRISSRIVGYYRILKFFGNDLRFKKT